MFELPDDQIPGLVQYVNIPGVVDSPVNRKAYRIVYAFVQHYNRGAAHGNGLEMIMAATYSKTHKRPVVFAGVVLEEGFVPVVMVMQTEFIGPDVLDMCCCQQCSEEPGHVCDMFITQDQTQPTKKYRRLDQETVDGEFAPIVQSWMEGSPNVQTLFTLFPDVGKPEGGTKGE